MMKYSQHLVLILVSIASTFSTRLVAQDSSGLSAQLSTTYIDQVARQSGQVSRRLDRQAQKALQRLQRRQARIAKKLARTDTARAGELTRQAAAAYGQLQEQLQQPGSLNAYIPSLDTLGSTLQFLQQGQLAPLSQKARGKLQAALGQVKGLEGRFQKAAQIKAFLARRQQSLREQLGQLGFTSELKQLNKQLYYYSAALNQYKELVKDNKKATQKALALLRDTRLFRDFMRKNSRLASLFRLPGEPGDPLSTAGLAGLQTRAQVSSLLQQQLSSAGGANARQQLQQNMQQAQSQLNQLKNKVLQAGGGGSDRPLPEGFRPNDQKTRTLLQRLELGANMQSQKANGYFPTTSDIGLSLGYKLNDKSIVGIGASYKMGWGPNIRNIRITHQGVGLRSFVDWKLKGSFWLSGGYELNYRSAFHRTSELRGLSGWQRSGLVGLSKIVSVRSKLLKKTKLQLLWDFLSYRQLPRTQPVLFRIGYGIQ